MRTGLTRQEKTTGIRSDEKDSLIHIRTHNTGLKKRLFACNRKYSAVCKLTSYDPEIGCREFRIEKGCFPFQLTVPYSEERERAASEAARNEQKGFRASLIVALVTLPRWSYPHPSFPPPKRSCHGDW